MSFTHTQSQICTTASVSSFIQRSDLIFAITFIRPHIYHDLSFAQVMK